MPRYLKTKVDIAKHFGKSITCIKDWANKEWWPQPTKRGWDVERLQSLVDAYHARVDTRGRAIPDRTANGSGGKYADLQVEKLQAEISKLREDGWALEFKNKQTLENLLNAEEVRQWMAERFLRIKNRIKLIPDEIQSLAPAVIRSQFRADIGIFVKELLLEMDSWKFKPESDSRD